MNLIDQDRKDRIVEHGGPKPSRRLVTASILTGLLGLFGFVRRQRNINYEFEGKIIHLRDDLVKILRLVKSGTCEVYSETMYKTQFLIIVREDKPKLWIKREDQTTSFYITNKSTMPTPNIANLFIEVPNDQYPTIVSLVTELDEHKKPTQEKRQDNGNLAYSQS